MIYYILVAVNIALSLLEYSVIIECLCSWIPGINQTRFYEFISKINYPFLNPVRNLMYRYTNGLPLDISPIILFLIIGVVRKLLIML